MPATPANGKICYIEMPATDTRRSADFYRRVFGWNLRERGGNEISFDDTTGEVSGRWVLGRAPSSKSTGVSRRPAMAARAATRSGASSWRVELTKTRRR